MLWAKRLFTSFSVFLDSFWGVVKKLMINGDLNRQNIKYNKSTSMQTAAAAAQLHFEMAHLQ